MSNKQLISILQPDLYKIQKDIIKVTKEIETLEKGKNNIQEDFTYGKKFVDLQKSITNISKEIEKLEKEKLNIQNIQVIQPPVTSELTNKNKIKRNVALASVLGLFAMLFLGFFLEYVYKYKRMKK